jgi:hypothetical protein
LSRVVIKEVIDTGGRVVSEVDATDIGEGGVWSGLEGGVFFIFGMGTLEYLWNWDAIGVCMVDTKARERVRAMDEISRATGVPPPPYFSKPRMNWVFPAKEAIKSEDAAKIQLYINLRV